MTVRRDTNLVGTDHGARLCGQHLRRAQHARDARLARSGGPGLFASAAITGAEVLALLAPAPVEQSTLEGIN